MSTFSLTPESVKVAGWVANGSTTPSYDEVVDMILEAEAEILGLFQAKNISYTAPSSDAVIARAFRQGKMFVKAAVRAEWAMVDGHVELSKSFRERADQIYGRIERNAHMAVGDDSDTSADAADLPYLPRVDKVYNGDAEDTDTGPITTGRRLIANREI